MEASRRDFLKKAGAGTVGLAVGGMLPGFSATGYSRIAGATDRIRVAIIGVNSRGLALAQNFVRQAACEIVTICDVDRQAAEKCVKEVKKVQDKTPKIEKDLRKVFEDSQIDAVVIATPDHWHTPAALMALQAGKHVYLEKPVSYCPREGEMLVEAATKYGKVLQVGTQRRSWPKVIEAIEALQSGIIGKPHYGKGWYANNRPSIGTGKVTAVPEYLNWDLWQGPAPRTVYKDNIVHYNWHWFWRWGTAESLNNGTHMIDLLCWGMNLKYPTKVSSVGGRYYHRDDWETPDTQIVSLEFGQEASLLWEGHSCNGKQTENASVGVLFYGDNGSLFISGGNDYKIYDKSNKLVKEVKSDIVIDPQNKVSPAQQLDAIHILNFFDGIRKGTPLNMSVEAGHKCTLLMQLANISLRTGRTLDINPADGHIVGDSDAQRFWNRSYEPGWEPKI
ncbi:MAG: Gfo/Idh/MocA family oxidoreductase [Bacteroidales bacterium]|jgi:predicted dehydrogenase|nr:Gfo/Idh/MocA family oxidoreductase [Bacteroidales bacterium]